MNTLAILIHTVEVGVFFINNIIIICSYAAYLYWIRLKHFLRHALMLEGVLQRMVKNDQCFCIARLIILEWDQFFRCRHSKLIFIHTRVFLWCELEFRVNGTEISPFTIVPPIVHVKKTAILQYTLYSIQGYSNSVFVSGPISVHCWHGINGGSRICRGLKISFQEIRPFFSFRIQIRVVQYMKCS